MIDLLSLFKTTGEYKAILSDKKNGTLSHAYLTLTPDGKFLDDYLKIIAKLIACEKGDPCLICRKCELIDKNVYSDVRFFPREDSVKTEDVNEIIEESYIKPIESDKKIFIISHAETMGDVAQNKLLKTLEEPPQNVVLLLGATSEFPLLSTVKSRVKKFVIPAFSDDALKDALSVDCPDLERLKTAIAAGDGTVGRAITLYNDEGFLRVSEVVTDLLTNMKKSSDVLEFSNKIFALKCDLKEFLSVLLIALRKMLLICENRKDLDKSGESLAGTENAEGFTRGAIVHAIEKTNEALKRKKFNANEQMVIEWLLFQILEGKYRWRK